MTMVTVILTGQMCLVLPTLGTDSEYCLITVGRNECGSVQRRHYAVR